MNAFGCIDNLARIWVHEKGLTTAKGKPLPRGEIGLAVHNTRVRQSLSQEFQEYLVTLNDWLTFVGNFRHSLAHRIPLYIPPYSIRPQDEAAYMEFAQQKMEASRRRERAEYDRLSSEQKKLTRFLPWIQHSYEEKAKPVVFHPQLIADFHTIEELGLKMLDDPKTLAA